MLKQNTYQEKFNLLAPWMAFIMKDVKKDLKNEHLKKDARFARHYLAGRDPNKLSDEELAAIYTDAIATNEKGEDLADYIANRWIMKHGELYNYFALELGKINPDFNELELLEEQPSVMIMEGAIREFGALKSYLFSVMNSVVFPPEIYTQLERKAHEEATKENLANDEQKKIDDLQSMQRSYDLQISRLTDKYEKKLQGLQKKYHTDIALLKKQIADLQRKMTLGT